MTREQIMQDYCTANGIITSPGKFEGEPLYVVAFWDAYLNGCTDDDVDGMLVFNLTNEDWQEWPELNGCKELRLFESDTGFVYAEHVDA